jgi:hypothetical protein
MVAGRSPGGYNEQQPSDHQTRRSRDLGVEAVEQDGGSPGEPRGLGAGVEPSRQVDEQAHGEAEQAEEEDDPAEAAAAAVAQHDQGEGGGKQGDREQQVGVRRTGCFGRDPGRACRRQARVARPPDLDRAVVDELGDGQAGGRGEDRQADRPLRGQHGAGPGRPADRQVAAAKQPAFQPREASEQETGDRARPVRGPDAEDPGAVPGPGQRRVGAPQRSVHRPVGPAAQGQRALCEPPGRLMGAMDR